MKRKYVIFVIEETSRKVVRFYHRRRVDGVRTQKVYIPTNIYVCVVIDIRVLC